MSPYLVPDVPMVFEMSYLGVSGELLYIMDNTTVCGCTTLNIFTDKIKNNKHYNDYVRNL